MFTVLHNNEEYPINHIQSAYRDFVMNDVPELSMIVVNHSNNPAYPYLNEEAIIMTPDGHEWRVKSGSEVTHYKNIKAPHILMDLTDMPFNQLLNGSYTPRSLLTEILSGTGFTLDIDETGLSSVQLNDFGRKNRWKCLKDATELLGTEYTVLPGRVIAVKKQLSTDKGKQYRHGHNLKNITKKSDSLDVVTHVIVNYGEEHAITETFVSPNASSYNRAFYGDIINDERITNPATAKERAEREFKDIDLSYELDVAQYDSDVELGETIHTIYEPLNDLSITTRILKIRDEWNADEFVITDATVGNYVFKPPTDIIAEQIEKAENAANEKLDEAKEIINKSMTLKFHETEEKILDQYTTVTTEYNAAISLSARELRTDMSQKVETINTSITAQYNKITAEYNSSISQTAQQIRTEVSASVTSIGNDIQNVRNSVSSLTQTASLIESRVSSTERSISNQGSRISSAESSISQQANQISSKVSQTDFTGRAITSLINQDPYSVSISAQKINFQGEVFGQGATFSGNISTLNDVNVGRNINMQGSGGGELRFPGNDSVIYSNSAGWVGVRAWNGFNFAVDTVDFTSVSSVPGLKALLGIK